MRLYPVLLALTVVACAAQAQSGVVVAQVAKRSEAERAGMKTGDSITGWARGTTEGKIESSFDLTETELEYSARGPMELRGRRGSQEQIWRMGSGAWGITARPVLNERALPVYQEGRDFADAGKPAEAAERWRAAAGRVDPSEPAWHAVWLLSEAATSLVRARQWEHGDEVTRLALQRASNASPMIRAQILESWAQTFYTRDWAQAELHFRESLQERRKLKAESLSIAFIISSLGFVARNQGILVKAEQYYREALGMAEKVAPDSLAVALFLNNVGAVAHHRGELIQAEDHYLQALAIRQKLAPESTYAVLNNLAAVASSERDSAKAEEYWQQALKLREKLAPDTVQTAVILNHLGNTARGRGDLGAAEGYYRRSSDLIWKLDPDSLDFGGSLERLGAVTWRRGEFVAAEEYHRRALGIREKLEPGGLSTALSLRNLGTVATSRGDASKAEEYHSKALKLREKLAPGSEDHADSLLRLAGVLRTKGQIAESVGLVANALDMLEGHAAKLDGTEEARQNFRAQYASDYRDYLDLLLDLQRPEQAFDALERSRARSLLSMIAERDLVFSSDLEAGLKQARKLNDRAYDRVQSQIADLPADAGAKRESLLARLRGLAIEREQIAEKIRRASPRLAALQYPQPLNLGQARETLDPGTVLLSYSVGPERTVLFVVQAAGRDPGLSVFTLPVGEQALQAQAQEFRRLVQQGTEANRAALGKSARALYDLLLKPAEKQLAAADRLLIAPDGPLHALPFAALLRDEKQYLVEWRPLHVVVSATVYAELKRMRRPASHAAIELLAFGDPIFLNAPKSNAPKSNAPKSNAPKKEPAGNTNLELTSALQRGVSLGRLPFSREEVTSIAALYPERSQTHVGADATEEKAKALSPKARYIHFATHAVLDERLPLNSALALTIPEKWVEGQENGLLQAWEIFEQVHLDADLVVLSACESGLGTEARGEGLIGLTRAFQYAGARSILASLWSVDDRRTAQLMKRFYGQLKSGKSKDEALQSAQLELIRGTASHPYYWAAFSLIGDWQ